MAFIDQDNPQAGQLINLARLQQDNENIKALRGMAMLNTAIQLTAGGVVVGATSTTLGSVVMPDQTLLVGSLGTPTTLALGAEGTALRSTAGVLAWGQPFPGNLDVDILLVTMGRG